MSDWIPAEYDQYDPYDADEIHSGKGQTGDICPWCGEPVQVTDDLVGADGSEVGDIERWPSRVFHERCYRKELSEKRADENVSLGEFTDE